MKTKIKKTSLVLILLTLFACKAQNQTLGPTNVQEGFNIFGDSVKVPVDKLGIKAPFTMIGKLYAPNDTYCTASLVGSNLILTAAHCVLSNNKILKGIYNFRLAYNKGTSLADATVTQITVGTTDVDNNRSKDWAILKINKSLGDTYGFFGESTIDADTFEFGKHVTQTGYGNAFFSGERMATNADCALRSTDDNYHTFNHDCATSSGDSGSPIYYCDSGECNIVAVHVAEYQNGTGENVKLKEYDDNYANVAVSSLMYHNKLMELVNK